MLPARKDVSSAFMTLAGLGLLTLLLHFVTNGMGAYGYFRDEFYYIACSDHLDWGYVDQPPLSILLLAVNRLLFGDSLFALRLFPALAGAGVVVLSGLMAKELGGNRFAQVLAAVSAIVAPFYLAIFNFLSMNSFDVLLWAICFYIVIKIIKTENLKLWLLFGFMVGLGLQNKLSVLFLCFGLAIGMLLTPHRKYLLNRWL